MGYLSVSAQYFFERNTYIHKNYFRQMLVAKNGTTTIVPSVTGNVKHSRAKRLLLEPRLGPLKSQKLQVRAKQTMKNFVGASARKKKRK